MIKWIMKKIYARQFAKCKLSIKEYYEKAKKRYWVTDKPQWYWQRHSDGTYHYHYWNEIY